MKAQLALQNLLRNRFFDLQIKNPSYSLRAFSKKVGLSPSSLSELLRGQRRVSKKIAERVAMKLMLDPQEAFLLLKDFTEIESTQNTNSAKDGVDHSEYLKLTADQFHLISEWTHYAILSLIRTDDFQSATPWIAKRLGITASEAETSLERLERLGLIEKDPDDHWKRTYAKIHTPDDVLNPSLQKAHIADMEIAKTAVQTVPVALRDFTSITVPTDPEVMPEVKAAIRRFREEMTQLMEAKSAKEVYQMSVYVYPLTQTPKTKKEAV